MDRKKSKGGSENLNTEIKDIQCVYGSFLTDLGDGTDYRTVIKKNFVLHGIRTLCLENLQLYIRELFRKNKSCWRMYLI